LKISGHNSKNSWLFKFRNIILEIKVQSLISKKRKMFGSSKSSKTKEMRKKKKKSHGLMEFMSSLRKDKTSMISAEN